MDRATDKKTRSNNFVLEALITFLVDVDVILGSSNNNQEGYFFMVVVAAWLWDGFKHMVSLVEIREKIVA
jgi:hypothetical protein